MPSDELRLPFRFSATLEAHESDVKAVLAPRNNLLLTASRDETVCSWGRETPADREFKLTGVGLGHGSYVNSVTYLAPTLDHPNGLIASGSLSSLILIHEGPSHGSWASNVDGEEGVTPGREARGNEDAIKTLVGHSSNVCSLSVSAPPLTQPSALQILRAASLPSSTRRPTSLKAKPPSRPTSSSSFKSFGINTTTSGSTVTPPPASPTSSTFNLTLPSSISTSNLGSSSGTSPASSISPASGSPITSSFSMAASPSQIHINNTSMAPPTIDPHLPEQLLISTSWDCTARVWGTKEWDEKFVLEGHKEAVWAGVIVEGVDCGRKEGERSFLTGSADRTIIHWDGEGKAIRNFKGSTDCVRGIVVLPSQQFASCSNDGNIHIWSFQGETISILTGHSSFIYSIALLPDGDLASSGEDHSVRIWRDGKQIQMILHPAISVWSVAALPNGDLLTGASDSTARIFSRDKRRLADEDTLQAYEEAVSDAVKSPPAAVDMRGSLSSFHLSVDVADDKPPIELEYNIQDEPREAATRFVSTHELPPVYVDQIESFLKAQLGSLTPSPAFDPAMEASGGMFSPSSQLVQEVLASNRENSILEPEVEEPELSIFSDEDKSLSGIARMIKSGQASNICILAGAGISTNAGIPDFRSPETGLYANLSRFNLPHAEAVFDLPFFKIKPEPFFELAKELLPGQFLPTPTHYFFRLLHTHGLLKRCFTQNIDTLETIAGLPVSSIVEAHGSFSTAHCVSCQTAADVDWVKEKIQTSQIPRCQEGGCNGLVKPGIVFFGEGLPKRFFDCIGDLSQDCDLLIVLGTSLKVQPFASLIDRVKPDTPRLLVNKEIVGEIAHPGARNGFDFDRPASEGGRDVLVLGDSDETCLELAKELGWETELKELMETSHAELKKAWGLKEEKLQADEGETLAERLEATSLSS